MPKKKYFIILGISLISALSLISFSYFVSNTSNDNNQKISIDNGTMQLLYTDCTNSSDCSDITGELAPGDSISKTFSVKNTGTLDALYKIVFSKSSNTFLDDELVYTLYNSDDNTKVTEGIVPYGDSNNYYIYTESIKAGETKNYKIDITFKNIESGNNESNENGVFNIKLGVQTTEQGLQTWNFDYTGNEQTFTAPKDGLYLIEVWGARGGVNGDVISGYGGYSVGKLSLNNNENVYIAVGERGQNIEGSIIANYNGGGLTSYDSSKKTNYYYSSSGGGATSIYTTLIGDGQLKNYESNKEYIIMVSGGGGGNDCANRRCADSTLSPEYERLISETLGGSGGGFNGTNGSSANNNALGYGGTQYNGGLSQDEDPGTFGQGGNSTLGSGGGGGGFYGGGAGYAAGGGSGYIGNSLLTDKHMACYNCETSSEESTKTISVTCASETPTPDCAKIGNGYARITYLGDK